MKLLASYDSKIEADIVRSKLEAYGIFALVVVDDVGGTRPSLQIMSKARLLVSEKDFAEAVDLINQEVLSLDLQEQTIFRQYEFLPQLIALAKKLINPRQIILFGSRARTDYRVHSDFDLAFDFPVTHDSFWGNFCTAVDEELPTLATFDLVNLREASDDLKRVIVEEGIVLYDTKDFNQFGKSTD